MVEGGREGGRRGRRSEWGKDGAAVSCVFILGRQEGSLAPLSRSTGERLHFGGAFCGAPAKAATYNNTPVMW